MRIFSKRFKIVAGVRKLGQGGESTIFKVDSLLPMEIVAKMANSPTNSRSLLLENHMLRLSQNDDCVCKVLEEIIIFDETFNEVILVVAIIEKAEYDLEQVIKLWLDPEK